MPVRAFGKNLVSGRHRQVGPAVSSNANDLTAWIADCAYYKAEKRQFEPGHEMEDWFEAEKEILQSISAAALPFGIRLKD